MPPQHQQGMLPPQLDRQLVFNAYAGMDPTVGHGTTGTPGGGMGMEWDLGGMGVDYTGFDTGPSSAWFMPFNMEPPQIGTDGGMRDDVFGGGYGMGMGGAGGAGAGRGMGGS